MSPTLIIAIGETAEVGRIEVTLGDCRYPEDNPTGEGYAWLTIRDPGRDTVLFDGWMVASSPALNALDHPRFRRLGDPLHDGVRVCTPAGNFLISAVAGPELATETRAIGGAGNDLRPPRAWPDAA